MQYLRNKINIRVNTTTLIFVIAAISTLAISLLSPFLGLGGAASIARAEPTVTVDPKLGPLKGGSNADDPAIWIHPTDRFKSLMFLSDKDAGIYVFDFSGNQLQHVDFNTSLNNIDVRYGFKFGNDTIDIVAGNLRDTGKLAVMRINPNYSGSDAVTVLADKNSSGNDIQGNSYGFTLYKRPSDGAIFIFDKPKGSTPIYQYLLSGDGGNITVTKVRDFKDVSMGVAEGMVADDENGFVYFAEESKGVHKYNADPDSANLNRLAFFATGDGISGDREGFAIYKCNDGSGYLVLSSQGNSEFKVYERQGNNTFVKTFAANQSDGTDGLDVNSYAAPGFPHGFAVIHDDPGAQYYVYDWAEIAQSDLTVCVDGGYGGTPTPPPPTSTPPPPTSTPPPPTSTPPPGGGPPPNFTIAFIGDQGITSNAKAVLRMILDEGTDLVIHSGDFDYNDDPDGWDQQINDILGPDFPYFISVGNHDTSKWSGSGGYKHKMMQRIARIPDADCHGDLGVNGHCDFRGFRIILNGAGTMGSKSEQVSYIQQQFANDNHIWRICSWHKNMNKMQVGGKGDDTGWGVYEACKDAGAIVATGHEHSYSRTYLMSSFENQVVVNQSSTLELDEGQSFAHVSGIAGKSIRNQDQNWPWMAAVYTSDQNANHGALFCRFNDNGNPNHASCYFKDIDGVVPDQFELISKLQGGGPTQTFVDVPSSHWAYSYIETLYQNGYVAGCSVQPRMYCPDIAMTRAESSVFVERGVHDASYLPPNPPQPIFADVGDWEWFYDWTAGLWNDGYTAGCSTNPLMYCPLQTHTMAEGAVFYLRMLRGASYEPPPAQGIFTDVPVNEWYARWVEGAYNAGIYPACQTQPDLRACPSDPLTRAMGAYMMVLAKQLPLQ
ncbi:MAG: phytase [Anaerolineales bacterium]|nr:phytase [Anaerolineales bacterium]